MTKNSFVIPEFNVPRTPEVMDRTYDYFGEIGWKTRADSRDKNAVYVHPFVRGTGPVLTYWHTANPDKINRFGWNDQENPSRYSKGLWHPVIQELTELSLIVPDEESVIEIYERGGELLDAHTHIPPRDHLGALEFRFTDPFNNSLRITANPTYEI